MALQKPLPSMYDTLELGEVKKNSPRQDTFFQFFLVVWHKNRFLGHLCVFFQLEIGSP